METAVLSIGCRRRSIALAICGGTVRQTPPPTRKSDKAAFIDLTFFVSVTGSMQKTGFEKNGPMVRVLLEPPFDGAGPHCDSRKPSTF